MKINWHITLFILFNHILLFNSSSFAAEDSKVPKLFSDANEMKVTFSGPWYTIGRNRKKDAFYPVKLTYTDADGQQHTIDAKVSPRGITRRLRVCKFPPLKIHFIAGFCFPCPLYSTPENHFRWNLLCMSLVFHP